MRKLCQPKLGRGQPQAHDEELSGQPELFICLWRCLGWIAAGVRKAVPFVFCQWPEGITAGMERIKIMGCSYTISAFMDCTIAASRGIGKSVAPTITVILGSYVFRAVWVYTVFAHFKRSARSICCTAFHGRLPRRLRSSISSEAATRCQLRMRRRHKSGAKAGTGRAYAHKHLSEGGVVNVTAVFQPECHGGGGHIPRISA